MSAALSPDDLPSLPAAHLPDKPMFVIEPRKAGVRLDFREWWIYRELFYFLIWRDIKVRYKQTLIGAGWAILQPLLTMVIFTFLFSKVAKIGTNGIPYPVFAYAALLPWTFFANALSTSGNSIVTNAHLITKVFFPRMLIPVASVCSGLINLAVGFPILVVLMFYYNIAITPNILILPLLVLLTTLLAIGVGMWLSAINVKYRDVQLIIPFLIQVWMYLSPVAYPSSVVPSEWRLLYSINPFVGILDAYRAAVFGQAFDWRGLGIAVVFTVGFVVFALYQFRKTEKDFADIV